MAVYRFRITFEDYDDISRDVEIRSVQTFEDLHFAIHSAIGFDAAKQASFYLSDDHWTKGQEITNRDVKESEKESVIAFKRSRLCDHISDPHQKIYYIFDPEAMWSFRIEMIKIIPGEELAVSYPRCIKVTGEAPKQYGNSVIGPPPIPEDFDPESLLDDDLDEEEGDQESDSGEELIASSEDVSDMGELDTNEEENTEEGDDYPASDDEPSDDGQDNEEY
jgi:hypothetical protein